MSVVRKDRKYPNQIVFGLEEVPKEVALDVSYYNEVDSSSNKLPPSFFDKV